jgi:hypothetical protein
MPKAGDSLSYAINYFIFRRQNRNGAKLMKRRWIRYDPSTGEYYEDTRPENIDEKRARIIGAIMAIVGLILGGLVAWKSGLLAWLGAG